MQPPLAIFHEQIEDFACAPQTIEGRIPEQLSGVFLRNGPGQQLIGQDRLHLLDGHSFVVAAHFHGGNLRITGKHTQTAAHRAEHGQSGQRLRYVFTNRPGGALSNLLRLKIANSAAHDVYGFGGKIYAADVFGHYALDVNTLETVGVSPLNALLEKPNDQLCPMPRVHPNGERLTAYRIRPGVFGSDQLTFVDMEADGRISSVRPHSFKGRANALHDIAITESHDVVVRWGRVALAPVALGTRSVGDAIALPPGDTIVHLLPRNSNEKRFTIRLPRQQIFHLFNAFREADTMVLDVVAYDEPIDFSRVHVDRFMTGRETPPRIRRHTIDLTTRRVSTQDYDASGEAPDIDQRRHALPSRFGYAAGVDQTGASPVLRSAYFWSNSTLKVDFDTGTVTHWHAPSGAFLSPPAFVPTGPGEDKGYVLTFMTLGNRSAVLVLDARDIAWGPIATAWFDTALPATSHTSWYGL